MKYVLCRPKCGLNDALVRIMRCYSYCEATGRTLLIDTTYNSDFFHSSFDLYFTFTEAAQAKVNIITNYEAIVKLLREGNFTIYPNIPKEKLFDYTISYHREIEYGFYIDGHNVQAFAILDPSRKYDEDLLLYNTGGGGDLSQGLLRLLMLNDWIVREFAKRYHKMPKPYTSIHIRNTDYKTDYVAFYNNNKGLIENNDIFLATDSKSVLDYFSSQPVRLFNYIQSLTVDNTPIHCNYKSDEKHRQVIVDTLCDLLMLALGNEFILTDSSDKIQSGFTKLAYFLFENKDVVYNLIGSRDALV